MTRTRPSAAPTTTARETIAPFEPIAGETYPNAKRLAGRFVQALTTYDEDVARRDVVGEAARPTDTDFQLRNAVRTSRPLIVTGARSRGEIVYPQLGGISQSGSLQRVSVMVVVRQTLLHDGGQEETVTRTVDVRLINRDDQWRIEELADAGGRPVRRRDKQLPAIAREVLDNPRIALPDSARWDIHAGIIDERLLRTMRDIAALFPYSVAVLKSGHPVHVFGTGRISGHTEGRGVDIWRVADEPVVLQQPAEDTPAHEFTTALLDEHDVPELGSPWDLDGPPEPGKIKPSFTDAVHADHIHVAFKAA